MCKIYSLNIKKHWQTFYEHDWLSGYLQITNIWKLIKMWWIQNLESSSRYVSKGNRRRESNIVTPIKHEYFGYIAGIVYSKQYPSLYANRQYDTCIFFTHDWFVVDAMTQICYLMVSWQIQ